MAALSGAAGSGLLVSNAAAQVARRDDDDASPALLVVQANHKAPILLAGHRSHRSHSSHSSHRSHYSGRSGGDYGGSTSTYVPEPPVVREPPPRREPPPPPPRPARVSFIAHPGGRIFIDDKPIGRDVTGTLILKPGTYRIRVENKFLGNHTESIVIGDGQIGQIAINW